MGTGVGKERKAGVEAGWQRPADSGEGSSSELIQAPEPRPFQQAGSWGVCRTGT